MVTAARLAAMTDQSPFDEAGFETQAKSLLDHREELLSQLTDDYQSLFHQLFGLVQTERKLLAQSQTIARFNEQNMLWTRTSSLFGLRELEQCTRSARWLGDVAAWQDLQRKLRADVIHRPLIYTLAGIDVGGLWLACRRRKTTVQDSDQSLAAAAFHAGLTAIRSASIATLMGFIAWWLDQTAAGSTWAEGVFHGLCAAVLAWPLMYLKLACSSRGLGPVHLGWSLESCRRMSRHVTWFLPMSLALLFVIGATRCNGNEVISDSLGRLAFVGLMACSGLFRRGVWSSMMTNSSRRFSPTAVDHKRLAVPDGDCAADSLGHRRFSNGRLLRHRFKTRSAIGRNRLDLADFVGHVFRRLAMDRR